MFYDQLLGLLMLADTVGLAIPVDEELAVLDLYPAPSQYLELNLGSFGFLGLDATHSQLDVRESDLG